MGKISGDVAIAYVERYTGLKLEEISVEEIQSILPMATDWAPLFSAPTITCQVTGKTLVEEVDFLWDIHGRIIYLTPQYRAVYKVEYNAGYSGFEDPNPAPDALESVVDQITDMELDIGIFESQSLGDYSYRIGMTGRMRETFQDFPNILSILNMYRRPIV